EAYYQQIDRRLAHINYWSPERWRRELAAAGFESPTIRGYLSPRQVRRWESWSNWTGGIVYRLKRGRQQPIDIQRGWGLRRHLHRPLRFLAAPLAALIGRGMYGQEDLDPAQSGCLLVVSHKAPVNAGPGARDVPDSIAQHQSQRPVE